MLDRETLLLGKRYMLVTMDLEKCGCQAVTNIQGSTLHTILLRDGRSVRRHTDQLRSRVEKENATGHGARNDDDFEYSVSQDSQ